jgi:uncharacterized phage protein gp47/JayE
VAVTLWGLTFGDTGTGFAVPTYAQLRAAAETKIRQWRGIANLQTQPGSLYGDIIDLVISGVDAAIQSAQDAVARTIFTAMRDVALDQFLADILLRVQAGSSTAVVYAYGNDGSAFAGGTSLRTSPNGPAFTTDGPVAVPVAPASAYGIEIVDFPVAQYAGMFFFVTVDGTPVSYGATGGDDGESVRAALVAAVNALGLTQVAYPGGTSPQNGRLCIVVVEEQGGGPFPLSVSGPINTIFSYSAIASPATAIVTGPTLAPAGSLRFLSLPAGIVGATNIEAAVPGRTRETDSQFRARHQVTQRGLGGGSPDAIRAIILSDAAIGGGGAAFCLVEYNPTDVVDAAGNKPHSVRVVVDAAADGQTVANALFRAKAAGDDMNGTETYQVMDTANPPAPHDVLIDRLVDVFFGVEILIEVGPDWPTLGSPLDQLRQDVTDYIAGLQPTSNGGAVRVNLLPISTFPNGQARGVINFAVRIGSGPAAGGPFTYEPFWPTPEPNADDASILLTGRQKAQCVITDVQAAIV